VDLIKQRPGNRMGGSSVQLFVLNIGTRH